MSCSGGGGYCMAGTPKPEMALGIVARKQQKSTDDDEYTLTLKLIGRVIRNVRNVRYRGYQTPTKKNFFL